MQQPQLKVQLAANPYDRVGFVALGPNEKQVADYKFNVEQEIGKGEFSRVYKGSHVTKGFDVAIKVIDKRLIEQNPIYKQLLSNEIIILQKVSCKSVLAFHGIYQTNNNIYLVTEYCGDGDLNLLIAHRNRIPEHNALKILKHLIKALLYLKEHGIIHRDIKTSNILVSNQIPKLADFGFAIEVEKPLNEARTLIGTPIYMAPEQYFYSQYSYKTDIWALGCVFYEMLFGQPPFPAKARNELEHMFKLHAQNNWLKFEGPITEHAKDFLKRVLAFDQKQRYDIYEAANHPLIQQQHPHAKN